MRKYAKTGLVALLCLAAIILACFEIRYSVTEVKGEPLSEKEILAEIPELALTEEDIALGKRLLADKRVQETMEQEEMFSFGEEESQNLLQGYAAEGATQVSVETTQNAVYVLLRMGEEKSVYLTFFSGEEYGPQKVIGIYDKRSDGTYVNQSVYENNNGSYQKISSGRRWFAYFRDKMWEES